MSGERDDRRAPLACFASSDLARRLQAVELGHLYIHQDQIEALLFECRERGLTGARDDDAVPALLQQALHHHLIDRVVLRHEDVECAARMGGTGRCEALIRRSRFAFFQHTTYRDSQVLFRERLDEHGVDAEVSALCCTLAL